MLYVIKGNKEHVENVSLYKVDDFHYILNIDTKEKYYNDYNITSGSWFIDKDKQFLKPTISINFFDEENDLIESIFQVSLFDDILKDFIVLSVTPLKHSYQLNIVHYNKAFVNKDMEEIELNVI